MKKGSLDLHEVGRMGELRTAHVSVRGEHAPSSLQTDVARKCMESFIWTSNKVRMVEFAPHEVDHHREDEPLNRNVRILLVDQLDLGGVCTLHLQEYW